MIFYMLSQFLNKNDLNINFVIIGGAIFYIVMLNYLYSNLLSLIIPLDLFLSFHHLYNKKPVTSNSKENNIILRKNSNKLLNNFIIDKISIQDTLDHTFKNIGIHENNIGLQDKNI